MIVLLYPSLFPIETPNPLEVPAAFGDGEWSLNQEILSVPDRFLLTDWGWEEV